MGKPRAENWLAVTTREAVNNVELENADRVRRSTVICRGCKQKVDASNQHIKLAHFAHMLFICFSVLNSPNRAVDDFDRRTVGQATGQATECTVLPAHFLQSHSRKGIVTFFLLSQSLALGVLHSFNLTHLLGHR